MNFDLSYRRFFSHQGAIFFQYCIKATLQILAGVQNCDMASQEKHQKSNKGHKPWCQMLPLETFLLILLFEKCNQAALVLNSIWIFFGYFLTISPPPTILQFTISFSQKCLPVFLSRNIPKSCLNFFRKSPVKSV